MSLDLAHLVETVFSVFGVHEQQSVCQILPDFALFVIEIIIDYIFKIKIFIGQITRARYTP